MRRAAWAGGAIVALAALWPITAGASGDYGCTPDWTLATSAYDCMGSAVISPRNDTRINMAWLLRERAGISTSGKLAYPSPDWENAGTANVFLSWDMMQAAFWPRPGNPAEEDGADYAGSRCQSLRSGSAAFRAALATAKGLGPGERERLATARDLVQPPCDGDRAAAAWPAMSTATGAAWLGYLQGARAFYADDFATARSLFAGLARAADPWLAETARYMVARTDLAAAQVGGFDEWGGFDVAKADRKAAMRASGALEDYLGAYPAGRYAASAIGLQRRAAWLSGEGQALAASYVTLLGARPPADASISALLQEAEAKSLFGIGLGGFPEPPLLLATWDLLRMRAVDPEVAEYVPKPLTADELAAQSRAFGKEPVLYEFLQASFAYHVAKDDRRVLALIPDDARAKSYTPLAFSRQVLRGLALERMKDRNAAGFWRELACGARDLYQRPAVELAFAMNRERAGALGEVFAPGSIVREAGLRVPLLEHVAGPELLRAQAGAKAAGKWERDVALFMLLAKELSRGRFDVFGEDLSLVPASASTQGWIGGWYDDIERHVPLGVFTRGKWQEGYPCPALGRTAATLASAPGDVKGRLCLAEFYRLNGFDDYLADPSHPPADQLGGSPDQFPGRPIPRSALYQAVLGAKGASAEDTAYALYRSIQCYAPSGNNACGGAEVAENQRRAWFQRLKRDYPKSRWATQLKYYW